MEGYRNIISGKIEIEYYLQFSGRKTLGITVNPDTSVIVTAPTGSSIVKVEEKIVKRATWIKKQQSYFRSFLPATPPREYVSGETHLYLGKQYRLKIEPGNDEAVKLIAGRIVVTVKDVHNKNRIKGLLAAWYNIHAKSRFNKKLKEHIRLFKNVEVPELEIKRMQKRWGSCTSSGKIILNPEIIKAPTRCIDYVIIHELCHLIHHKHDNKFFLTLTRVMPDWEKWKLELDLFLI